MWGLGFAITSLNRSAVRRLRLKSAPAVAT
jgi:hypothetical protein